MALSEKGVVRLKGNNKDEQKEESFTVNTKEYDLLISVRNGTFQLAVNGAMRFFLPACLAFMVFLILPAIYRNPLWVPSLKLQPDLDSTAYMERVNTTIGSLIEELEVVQAMLSALHTKGRV